MKREVIDSYLVEVIERGWWRVVKGVDFWNIGIYDGREKCVFMFLVVIIWY